ncbi:MAG: U32 family peptidase, partial [Cyanobacteriota bacterium]
MTEPKLIVPINKEGMIIPAKSEGADILYVDFRNFVKNNRFSKPSLIKFIKVAQSLDIPIYLHFGEDIYEEELDLIEGIVNELSTVNVDGIMINDFSVLETIKNKKIKQLRFKVHLDSGLNIHNIASYEILKKWKARSVNITEEIYLKNVTRIKKYTGKNICINVNESMWMLHYAVNWGIDLFKISGSYKDVPRICLLISLLKELISDTKRNKTFDNIKIEQVLNLLDHSKPQKHYRTDHFTKKFKDYSGNDFEFTGSIKVFNWKEDKIKLPSID